MAKDLFKAVLITAAAQLMSLVFLIMCTVFLKNTVLGIIAGLCSAFILYGLTGNYAYTCAEHDASHYLKDHSFCIRKAILTGIFSALVPLIMWVILLISKLQLIGDFLPAYRLLNGYFYLITSFCSQSASEITFFQLTSLLAASLLPAPVFVIVYNQSIKKINL